MQKPGNAENRKCGNRQTEISQKPKPTLQKVKIAAFVYGFILDVERRKR